MFNTIYDKRRAETVEIEDAIIPASARVEV
jgi:hypothetical protein